MISLIVLTYRPGGLDLLADSLVGTHKTTHTDWELVVIDDFPGRVQRGDAAKYLRDRGLPLGYYGHSKPKTYEDTKSGLCNASNTALIHARGDWTVWLSDYTMLPPYWLLQWEYHLDRIEGRKWMMSGSAIEYYAPKPAAPDDIKTWQTPPQMVAKKPWVPLEFETFYYGAPIEFFEQINGLDERADHCHCWPVSSTIAQARLLGYELNVSQEVVCHMVDHRMWDDPEKREEAPPGCGGEGLWRITHLQSTEQEPEWTVPSPNPLDLVAAREYHGVRRK